MTKVIGIGGCGTNVINYIATHKVLQDLQLITINDNAQVSHQSLAHKSVVVDCNFDKVIEELLHGNETLFIVSGLGGNTSAKYMSRIANACNENKIDVKFIVVMPFAFEGRIKQEIANSLYLSLSEMACDIVVISNNDLLARDNLKNSIEDIFAISNQKIISIIENAL
ncbi:MAG: hypothetical protein Q7T77_08810 [Sulfuricurvum sp.]|nr:hypothetical protein [Sulfuricurvum sp.]